MTNGVLNCIENKCQTVSFLQPYGYEYGIIEKFTGNLNMLNALKTLFNINHTIPRDANLLSLS